MKVFSFLLLLSVLVDASPAKKALLSSAVGKKADSPKLYHADTDAVSQEGDALLPRRIYAVYIKERKGWFFALTNARGNLPIPLEVFYPGSILPGSFLGAKNPLDRFKLTKDWKWVATKKGEQHFLWVVTEPPAYKKVTFLYPQEFQKKP